MHSSLAFQSWTLSGTKAGSTQAGTHSVLSPGRRRLDCCLALAWETSAVWVVPQQLSLISLCKRRQVWIPRSAGLPGAIPHPRQGQKVSGLVQGQKVSAWCGDRRWAPWCGDRRWAAWCRDRRPGQLLHPSGNLRLWLSGLEVVVVVRIQMQVTVNQSHPSLSLLPVRGLSLLPVLTWAESTWG